jgi:adenylosuccinate lyase
VAWDNAAHHLLERTLDDSGNRRTVLPDAFLATDEILKRLTKIVTSLRIDSRAVARNLAVYGTFAATERVLMDAARHGGDRQELHEVIREHSLAAWEAIKNGEPNPLTESLPADQRITRHIAPDKVRDLLDASAYVGDAPARACQLAAAIRREI